MNSALNSFSAEELVEMAETCNSSFAGQISAVIQIFEKFEQPPQDAFLHFNSQGQESKPASGLNKTGDVRILDFIPGIKPETSYVNKLKIKNTERLSRTMNGLNSAEPGPALERQLVHLQVRGRNQLLKEIVETHAMPEKHMDLKALHRNEVTKE